MSILLDWRRMSLEASCAWPVLGIGAIAVAAVKLAKPAASSADCRIILLQDDMGMYTRPNSRGLYEKKEKGELPRADYSVAFTAD